MDLTLRFASHPSEEVLEAYALKRLPEDQVSKVEMHLLACEACQHSLADLDSFIASMKSVPPQTRPLRIPLKSADPSRVWKLAVAACVVAGALFMWTSGAPAPPAAVVVLSAMRGSETAPPTAPANVPLDVSIVSTAIDDRQGFQIEIVTASGDLAWSGPVTRSADGKFLARANKGFFAGSYWVRLYSPDRQLLQEFGLRLN